MANNYVATRDSKFQNFDSGETTNLSIPQQNSFLSSNSKLQLLDPSVAKGITPRAPASRSWILIVIVCVVALAIVGGATAGLVFAYKLNQPAVPTTTTPSPTTAPGTYQYIGKLKKTNKHFLFHLPYRPNVLFKNFQVSLVTYLANVLQVHIVIQVLKYAHAVLNCILTQVLVHVRIEKAMVAPVQRQLNANLTCYLCVQTVFVNVIVCSFGIQIQLNVRINVVLVKHVLAHQMNVIPQKWFALILIIVSLPDAFVHLIQHISHFLLVIVSLKKAMALHATLILNALIMHGAQLFLLIPQTDVIVSI